MEQVEKGRGLVWNDPVHTFRVFLVVQMVKNLPANARHGCDLWVGKIPWRRK